MSNSVPQTSIHGQFSTVSSSVQSLRRVDSQPTPHADIAKRAYQKFEARGSVHGFDREDWAAADRELIAERAAKPRP